MKNPYVGDLGDFGKYGLLRALCALDLALGVIWYLTPDQNRNGHGQNNGYLEPTAENQERFRSCDPNLYDALEGIVKSGARNILSIQNSGILPANTIYYKRELNFFGLRIQPQGISHRESCLREALDLTRNCDLVFLDPDIGLKMQPERYERRGPEYTLLDETQPYLFRGQSLVIYNHNGRQDSAQRQVQVRLKQLGTGPSPSSTTGAAPQPSW